MIILVGPSACGKTVMAKALIEKFNFKKFVTTTTRKMRIGEINDVDYHFVDEQTFLEKIKNNEFIEYVGDKKVIILEPNGLKHFLSLNDKSFVSFYITCDPKVREARMIERGDKKEDIDKRLLNDIFVFDDSLKDIVDFSLDSSTLSIDELARTIYFLYEAKRQN